MGECLLEDGALFDGSLPLGDIRAERYCNLFILGEKKAEAWQKAFKEQEGLSRSKHSSATSSSARLHKHPFVEARIAFLRSENAKVSRLDVSEKLRITEEVISGLREDFKKGERGKTVNDLMSALERHDCMTTVGGGAPVMEIRLNLGDLLKGASRRVDERLKMRRVSGDVIDISGDGDGVGGSGTLLEDIFDEKKGG